MFSWPGRVDGFPQIFSEHFSEEHSENATGRDYEAVSKGIAISQAPHQHGVGLPQHPGLRPRD